MKINKAIYWISTGIIGLMMLFSAYEYLTAQQMREAFVHLGFPNYFRIELAVFKIIGSIVLLAPPFSNRLKEWAYAGLGIVFISASIAHYFSGDGIPAAMIPLAFLIMLIIFRHFLEQPNRGKSESAI
ncbi:DoxX family protein [Dyadobacter sp. LJ53]|uniref:DoxX family protein n=1 Tax=Dyadobacter chenwenxiniae TaxID=2906456 RepID=UPI001F2028B1|nr:DoxX family protein [Dyadobacter chenwenxiniae]MCF0051657.1 DoxX family protein [Dyadobacter chenwenxiniae]